MSRAPFGDNYEAERDVEQEILYAESFNKQREYDESPETPLKASPAKASSGLDTMDFGDYKKLVETLKKPLPNEAISQHPTKKYLSTIKAIYVVERFNDAFGLGGWRIHNQIERVEGAMIVIKSVFTASDWGIRIEAYGGNDNQDLGDAYKGACTDALTKIGSYLYVGMDVYKGLGSKQQINNKVEQYEAQTTPVTSMATQPQYSKIKYMVEQLNLDTEIKLEIRKRLNIPVTAELLTKRQASAYIEELSKIANEELPTIKQ